MSLSFFLLFLQSWHSTLCCKLDKLHLDLVRNRFTSMLRQFHRTCGSNLPQSSGASTGSAFLLPTDGKQMCKDANSTWSCFSRKYAFLKQVCVLMIMIHLPQVHLLLEEVRKLLFPLCTIIFTTTGAHFIIPARYQCQATGSPLSYITKVVKIKHLSVTKVVLPFKAVALLPSFIKARLETKCSFGLFALSFNLGAECSCPLQLGSYSFGVTTVVAGTCAVGSLVPKELGDGGMATTGGKIRDTAIKNQIHVGTGW